MSDVLNEEGLTIQSLNELVTALETGFKDIYGDDINVASDTPDGQLINIFAQGAIDLREVLQDIYTSFDPDQAQGTVLDQRVGINGITRRGATFTIVPISVTVDRSVTLTGLDTLPLTLDIPSGVFTVKDDSGTQFVLLATTTISAGTHSLSFRAAEIGEVLVTSGTINTVVTATAGVTLIANTEAVTTQGVNEETDAALKLRRRFSIMNSSTGYLETIEGSLKEVTDVSEAFVYENTTNTTDGYGIPAHGIWCIVSDGADADIAAAIYAKRPAGVPMKGSQSVVITRPNGYTFTALFDRPTTENLYVKFTLTYRGGGVIDKTSIKNSIVANVFFLIGETATGDTFTTYVKSLDSNYIITGMLLSTDNAAWTETAAPTGKNYRFVLSTTRITIS